VAADLAQDGELILVKRGDRRRRTDVGQAVSGDAVALAARCLPTSDMGRILRSPVSPWRRGQRPGEA
jgi:hypothetical protein